MLFFHPDLGKNEFVLEADESAHLVRVLRKKQGDRVEVTDGNGIIATVEVKDANAARCLVEIVEKKHHAPDPFYIHIAVAPTKNIDRIAWFVEKAVEIGIHEISFPICKHSERKVINTEKLVAKAKSAMKQSLSPFLPKINEAQGFLSFIKSTDEADQKFIAHLENDSTPQLISMAKKSYRYCIIIGPEGDFDEKEIDAAVRLGFELVKMGNKRLRTETAALHACSMLNVLNYHYLKYF